MPTLRFPGFTDEWETLMLSEIAPNISAGRSGNPIENGDFYLYGSTGIIGKTNNAQYQGEKILIARVGANAGKISYNNETCGITDNTLIVKSAKISARYLYYYLTRYNLNRLIFGSGQPLITGGMLKKIPISFPELIERNKIISFLSLLDERIALQSKLIDRLKSLMDGIRHRLFEKSTVYQSLGNIVEIRKGKQINGSELLDDGEYPVMNGGITPSGFLNEYNTPPGTISISEGGNSCGYVQFNATPIWSGGHCYTLHLICGDIDYRYLYHFLKHSESEIMKLRIGSGLPNIQKKDLSKFPITSYPISNQMKISKTLDVMEARILNGEFMLQSYAKLKAYLLSVMFI